MATEVKINEGYQNKVFWREDFNEGMAKGGCFYRSFDLNQFLNKIEAETDDEIVGIKFEGNNLEVIFKDKTEK